MATAGTVAKDQSSGVSRVTRALVVDDERMNREVVVANLRAAGYETVTAEDGQQAWEILDRMPGDFDVILLDRRMPRMDGMELLARLKGDERLRPIPVIMQTAYASSEDVVEGIKAGVYYYLGKPLDRRLLLSVAAAAVEDHHRFRRLSEDLERRTTALVLMDSGKFRFRTPAEGNTLAVALARACPQSQFLAVGLSEIFTNAVEHGNLGITFDEKARLIADKRLAKEIEARLDAPLGRTRFVEVLFERLPEEIRISVRDEGAGFDWRRYMDLDTSRAFSAHGRGIAMARRLSFDRLEYRDPGNEVLCVVRGSQGNAPAIAPPRAVEQTPVPPVRSAPMEDDIKVARAMQVELLPPAETLLAVRDRHNVAVSGFFETSSDLGGDLWGLDPLDESRFAVWLADFSGHGVTAAMNTFRLHALLEHLAERDRPAVFLAELNSRLAGLLPLGQYATMLYGVVDVARNSFTYAGAAAPPPVAVHTSSLRTEIGNGAGLPLGVSRNASYVERSMSLGPGTLLFMASDALTESPAEDGSLLGQTGAVDLVRKGVSAHGTATDVHAILAPFLATIRRPLRDDLTAICCVLP